MGDRERHLRSQKKGDKSGLSLRDLFRQGTSDLAPELQKGVQWCHKLSKQRSEVQEADSSELESLSLDLRWDASDTQGAVAYRFPWMAKDRLVQEHHEVLPLLVGLSRHETASGSPCKADLSSKLGHLENDFTSLSLSFHISKVGITVQPYQVVMKIYCEVGREGSSK